MSSVTESGTRSSSGKRIGALILAILGVVALIVAAVYLSTGHHILRTSASAIAGVVLLAAAWWVGFRKSGR